MFIGKMIQKYEANTTIPKTPTPAFVGGDSGHFFFFFFFLFVLFFLLVVLVRIPAVEESIVCSWPSPSLWPLVSSERSGALKERRGLTASCPHSEDTTVSVVVATQADC